jgi:hypothetical protein
MAKYTHKYREVLLLLGRNKADGVAQQVAAAAIETLSFQVALARIALTNIRDSFPNGTDMPIVQNIASLTLQEMDGTDE